MENLIQSKGKGKEELNLSELFYHQVTITIGQPADQMAAFFNDTISRFYTWTKPQVEC